jgi:hypothetical protein
MPKVRVLPGIPMVIGSAGLNGSPGVRTIPYVWGGDAREMPHCTFSGSVDGGHGRDSGTAGSSNRWSGVPSTVVLRPEVQVTGDGGL